MSFWLPQNKDNLRYLSSKVEYFRSFFGRIEDTKKTFRNQLTFTSLEISVKWLIRASFTKPDLSVSRPRPVQPLQPPPLPWQPHAASAFGTDDWYDDHKVLLHRHDIPRGRCQGCPRSMEAAKSSRSSGMSRFGFGDLTAPGELENSGHRLKLKFDF